MIKKLFLAIIVSIILFISLFSYIYRAKMAEPLVLPQDSLLVVHQGSSLSSFSSNLVKKGWLANRFWLRNYGRFFPKYSKIKTGTYLVKKGSTVKQLLSQVVSGQEHQFSITFIEGSIFKEWLAKLSQEKQLKQTLQGKSIAQISHLLNISQENPEGWFFPETYAFTANTTDIDILKRAHQHMKNSVDKLWQNKAEGLPYKNKYQALIMASIIEKESSYLAEQPLIASVFINRLAINMRLQTDPTVIYGLGERYHGDITRAHLKEQTAYNTYRINGFPPTPIAMPGLLAIKAALQPAKSDYFYFVSDGAGKHTFSKNLADHNKALKRLLSLPVTK